MKKYLFIALLLFSCKRDADTTPPPANNDGEKISVRLALGGDISLSWSNLRTIYDSTVYAVNIKTKQGALFAQGLFDTKERIQIDVLKDSSYIVNVAAIRKGSSPGLWWEQSTDGFRQYAVPLHRKLQNKMVYSADVALEPNFIDSLSNMKVLTDTMSRASNTFPISELDSYYGTTNYTARNPDNTTINIEMTRLVYALRYDIHNLSSGYVLATYGGKMAPDTLRTNDTLPVQVYTYDGYRSLDPYLSVSLPVTLTWVKGNGTSEAVGTKTISSRRNTITYISVYVNTKPADTHPNITLTDTTWFGTDDFNY